MMTWIISCYKAKKINLDYSIESLKHLDKFMDDNEKDESNCATIRLPDETIIFPMQGGMKRFYNGPEDGTAFYGKVLIEEFLK